MFSERLKKAEPVWRLGLFGVVAGLVFICQLAALVMVASEQVEKARLRDVQYKAAKTAMSDCTKNYAGPALTLCFDQVNIALNPYPSFSPESMEPAPSQAADQNRNVTADLYASSPIGSANTRGFIKAAFDKSQ